MSSAQAGATSSPASPGDASRASRRAAAFAAAILACIYALTTAPSVTWWDAGEFVAAVETLGIPHPPGTPLYILLANVWSRLLGIVERAHAVNLFSAACTALAGAAAASLVARGMRSTAAGVAAAICAGTMATVWASATEAEVYGPALLLAMLTLLASERAGRTGESRYVVLTAYLFALAAPLHVTALIAAPAAVALAATAPTGELRRDIAALLAAAFVVSGAIGTGRWWMAGVALALLIGAAAVFRPGRLAPAVVLIGVSALAFLLVRAQHDPGINQGNPATLAALLDVIEREQYTIAGLWPRQAPAWLQVVNFLEYADWQVALGLGPTVMPTIPRMAMTIAYIALGVVGFLTHRRTDVRSWRALAVLGLCGSLGVIVYLNLKAGPSIGYGILPDDAPHEPRERDYFFAFAFWTWGLWAGLGAMSIAARWLPARGLVAIAAGLVIAGLPAGLNWPAVDRRREPEASLPRGFAEALLDAAPPRAVLLVGGDNDTYPLWYLQRAEAVRPDVTVLTYPLLGAGWYRDELHRRAALGTPPPHEGWAGLREELRRVVQSANDQARPIAVAVTVERAVREMIAPRWRLSGLVYLVRADSTSGMPADPGSDPASDPVIDVAAAEAAASRLESLLRGELRPSIDPTPRLMREALTCPSLVLRAPVDTAAARSLVSACNSR